VTLLAAKLAPVVRQRRPAAIAAAAAAQLSSTYFSCSCSSS
jgi:hypothetical protein